VRNHPVTWSVRVLWLTLPFTLGDALGNALVRHSTSTSRLVTIAGWICWAVVLVASLIPRPATLTLVRVAMPAALPLAVWVCVDADVGATAVIGLATAAICAVAACTAWVADDFVDGASYGDERRWSLRAPGALVAGPIPIIWSAGVAGATVGPLLLATAAGSVGRLVIASLVTLIGLAVFAAAIRSLHTLSTRCAVMVPAGLTLVDPLSLGESALFPRARMRHLGPAFADTDALDLSQRALGLALQVDMASPVELLRRDGRHRASQITAGSIVFTPGRPGALLRDAAARRMPVGSS
jgi:hypothetical protein